MGRVDSTRGLFAATPRPSGPELMLLIPGQQYLMHARTQGHERGRERERERGRERQTDRQTEKVRHLQTETLRENDKEADERVHSRFQ